MDYLQATEISLTAKKQYDKEMEEICGAEKAYIHPSELERKHRQCFNRAIQTFKSAPWFYKKYEDQLRSDVQKQFEHFKKHNESRKNKFTQETTPLVLFAAIWSAFIVARIFGLIWLESIAYVCYCVMVCFLVLLCTWCYIQYSGEFRPIALQIDTLANAIWDYIPDRKSDPENPNQEKSAPEPDFTASVDFGTSHCSWSLTETVSSENPKPSSTAVTSKKVPTSALIEPDGKTLRAFGHDAESLYKKLAAKGQHIHFYYFLRFKMALDTETISRDVMIEDVMGKSLPAKRVFALSFEYITNEVVQMGKEKNRKDVTVKDFHWALSVPAVWSEPAKQFMRKVAEEANIKQKDISIGYDTEATALYCRHVTDITGREDEHFKVGARYMILDAGAGKVQLSVQEVSSSGDLMEITVATGHSFGGYRVNKGFEDVLVEVFSKPIYTAFKKENTSDWLQLVRDFEELKKSFDPYTPSGEINIPSTLISHTSCTLQQLLHRSKFNTSLEANGNGLKIRCDFIDGLFDKSLSETVKLVRSSFQKVDGVTTIYMVGGFSASLHLQQAIKKEFPDLTIVNPKGEAVAAGTLFCRQKPNAIKQRVLKKTYGFDMVANFEDGIHPESKRRFVEGKHYCEDVFSKHVERGQTINVGERQKEERYVPVFDKQDSMTFNLYSSDLKNPKYCDAGCTKIGKLTLDISDVPGNFDRIVLVTLTFSQTEITATARAEKTGKSVNVSCDFLG